MSSRSRRRTRQTKGKSMFDWTLLFITIFLVIIGLVLLYSVSSYDAYVKYGVSTKFLQKQLVAVGAGFAGMIFFIVFDYHILRAFAFLAYVISAASIVAVLFFGSTKNGATRWIDFFGVSIQPAEIAKLGVIIFFAAFLCKCGRDARNKENVIKAVVLGLLMSGLILVITKNLSSAVIVMGIVIIMLFVDVPDYKFFVLIGAIGTFLATVLVILIKNGVIHSNTENRWAYRIARIEAWLSPEAYSADQGFQTLQSLYAIGSGGVFGKGLGQSMQKLGFIPEAQNDMIFSIICEELGLFGAFAIMILFFLMIWRLFLIASNAEDQFGSLLVVGVMAHISLQVIFNIGVVTNLIPNTGITLPFISYGGTAMLFLLIEIGIALGVSKHIREREDA